MVPSAQKSVIVISAASITNAETTTGTLDTVGYDFAIIDTCATTSDSTSNNFATMTLAEGDTTSAYTNVSGFVGDTDFTIANADTSNSQVVASMRVDLRGRKRHLQISASPVTTQVIWCHATLLKGDVTPITAASANVGVLVEG